MHLKQVFRAMGIKTMTNSIQKQFESSTQFSSDIQESLLWNEYVLEGCSTAQYFIFN